MPIYTPLSINDNISTLHNLFSYDAMPNLKPEIVYPFNRQYSMSAAKVCWVNSVACN